MLGFTRQEQGVVLFLGVTLLVGCVVTLWQRSSSRASRPEVPVEVMRDFEASVARVTATVESGVNTDSTAGAMTLINVNRATVAELKRLPGIGSTLAARIVAYRETRGRIVDDKELLKIKGIGQSTLEKIRPYLTLE